MKAYALRSVLAFSAAALSLAAQAEVLISEGCDTVTDYAGASADGVPLLGAYPKSYNASIGLKGGSTKWLGYGSTPRVYSTTLPLPASFADAGLVSKGAACLGFRKEASATDHRWAYLELASERLKAESGTTLYFRGLMNVDKTAAERLSKPTSDAIGNNNSYGLCFTTMPSTYSGDKGTPIGVANNLGFYLWKNKSGGLVVSVRVTDASKSTTTSKRLIDGLAAPTAGGVSAVNTILCYAEVKVGAGTDGKEVIRAGAVRVSDYNMDSVSWSEPFELELISNSAYPTHLAYVGDYGSNGYAVMDEFVVGTELSDIIAVAKDGAPTLSDALMSGSHGTYSAGGTLSKASATDAGVVAHDGVNPGVTLSAGAVAVEDDTPTPFSKNFTSGDLTANKTYGVYVYATNAVASVSNSVGSVYTGVLTLSKVKDADEYKCVPGEVTVSRASADSYPLTVNYTLSSSAVGATEGKTWEVPTSVTIPAGATSATLTLRPKNDSTITEDIVVTLSVTNGFYEAVAQTVDITLKNLVAPSGYNTWIATADGAASVASNWSAGRSPLPSDKVLFDGNFSTASCTWDSAASSTVASWTQREGYTGTVQIDTAYDGSFTALTVSGDVEIQTGSWTHRANSVTEAYRLKVLAGGDVTIGSAAKINAAGKGFAINKARPGSAAGCHASPMDSAGVDKLYGDMKKPEALGSGNAAGAGGGAVYIEAVGAFSNDGTISVASAGGASGSIYIKAASVSGAGTYSARSPISIGNNPYQAGSGGRIAFELTSASTITDNEDEFVNGKCSAGFSLNSRNSAAGGTIFVKSPTRANGVLYVSGQSGANYGYTRLHPEFKNMLAIPASESWTLDGIVILNAPIAGLRVAAGTTLSLPNGLASVKAYGSGGGIGGSGGNIATGNRGLVVDGGDLVLPSVAEHLIANNWTLQANKPYTLNGNVRVNAGGRIGVVAGYGTNYAFTNRCDLSVTGDLTIESKGSIDANGAGWKNYADTIPAGMGFFAVQQHGAHGGVSKNLSDAIKYSYDSILNPTLPGTGAQSGDAGNAIFGGGCVKLTVGGKLTLAGSANAKSPYQDHNGGGGGTINITCGSIEGAGTINVTTQTAYGGTQGGGGRVAIRLTDANADFANYPLSRITVAQSGDQSSGGTIYLQTAANGENGGTVYIKGDASNTATVKTPFPSLHGGGEKDDFRNATLVVTGNGKAILSANAKARELSMVSGTLDLNGKTLKVNRAFMNGTKLANGTYTAASAEVAGYVTDSVTGGELIVKGGGLVILFQ